MPFAPFEQDLGPFCEFNIYHVMPIDDPLSLFPITIVDIAHEIHHHVNGMSNGHSLGTAPSITPRVETKKIAKVAGPSRPPKPSFKEIVLSGRKSASISQLASIVRSKNVSPRGSFIETLQSLMSELWYEGRSLRAHIRRGFRQRRYLPLGPAKRCPQYQGTFGGLQHAGRAGPGLHVVQARQGLQVHHSSRTTSSVCLPHAHECCPVFSTEISVPTLAALESATCTGPNNTSP